MPNHPDYCPISIGAEILGDRWTPLVIRELSVGAEGFNEIHRGLPRMSRTLLAQRLRALERRGLVRAEPAEPGRPGRYVLTPAGEGLVPIVWAMGRWAAEWAFSDPTDADCDGLSAIWRLHQRVLPERLPRQRTVVQVVLTGAGAAQAWLDIEDRVITVCKDAPNRPADLLVTMATRDLLRWLIGLVSVRALLDTGLVQLAGPAWLVRAFPTWVGPSVFADGFSRAEQRRQAEDVPKPARRPAA